MIESRLGAYYSISCTTRPKREGEQDGVDYHFLTPAAFKAMIDAGAFLEWEEVHDNLYGTPKQPIYDRLSQGQLVVLDVDVKGALQVKRLLKTACLIFIMPPSWETLEARLIARGKDTRDVIAKRLMNARKESECRDQYDYIVINDDLERVYQDIEKIITSSWKKGT